MRKVKKWNKSIALAAACILLALTAQPDTAYGAVGIDTERKNCSITFNLNEKLVIQNVNTGTESETTPEEPGTEGDTTTQELGTEGETTPEEPSTEDGTTPGETGTDGESGTSNQQTSPGFDELLEKDITVNLYKVADVNVSGKYVEPNEPEAARAIYSELKVSLDKVSSSTGAGEWQAMAETAKATVEKKELAALKTGTISKGEGTIGELSTGLYLVLADKVITEQYIYSFTPYLVSLPGNEYKTGGEASDTWLYDVEVGLKPGRENRFGDLVITKSLTTFNETLGGANFIFQIEAEKDGIVYSDVQSIVFNGTGNQSITIEGKIPAGAVVTVTEVYSGASYKVTSASPQRTTIVAAGEDVSPASVNFTNEYDHRLNGGTSVVNHFENTAQENERPVWNYVKPDEETQELEGGAGANEAENEE